MDNLHSPAVTADEQRLGQALINSGIIDPIQLDYALQKQTATGERLSQALVRLGLVSAPRLARVLAEHNNLPYADSAIPPDFEPQAQALFTREACIAHALLPVRVKDGQLEAILGNGDPHKAAALIQRRSGLTPRLSQGDFAWVSQQIERLYSERRQNVQAAFEAEYQKVARDTHGSFPIDELVRKLLRLAVHERATDIHLQPESRSLHVAFRIDGVLIPILAMNKALMRLVSAIKVMAAMDISDNLRPQDGRFTADINDQKYDVRASTSITPEGESVVLRLLPKGISVASLEELGFAPEHLQRLYGLFQQPHGIFLMTGPTGSGKTSTLHAGLRPLGMTGKSILTVEDPIEYELPVAAQTQVNRKAGYTFDTAIRHFLRHDPDIMLVGEIRDRETADAAMRAAETGHLVLSTLHVNSVSGIVRRLEALGTAPLALAETLIGCINQRLLRRLCEHCKEPVPPPDTIPAPLLGHLSNTRHWRGKGCQHCRHTGFYGRIPVYEVLMVDQALSRWIEQGGSRQQLPEVLNEDNHVSLWQTGARLIRNELTTVDELTRVFGTRDALPT